MRRTANTTLTARCTAGITAAAVLVTQLVLPPHADASHLGSSTASAGSAPPPAVSAIQSFQPDLFTGRATTAIPIAVPPGRKGMQPSLALTYSSSGRNGWLGMGWMLDAGYIERSTRNGVPRYDSSDTYTFMFQGVASDLVKIPDGTYRAKDEGLFLRFENKGVSGWEVRDKSGTRYLFGQTVASQIESTGQVFRWALDKVVDANGNTLTATYTKDQNQLYPTQIDYTGHEPTSLALANRVVFTLEARPDLETSYRSGFAVTTAKRLKTIETKATVGGVLSLARRYQLAYTTSPRTGRSLLSSVQQFGTDGTTSLPPATFAYQDGGPPTYTLNTITPTKPQLAGDADGNGTSDLMAFDTATGAWTVSCTQQCTLGPSGTWLSGFGNSSSIPVLGDWNGDGKTDIAVVDNASGTWQFATSTGTSFQANTISSLSIGIGTPFTGDFNGDGKTDIGLYAAGAWTVAVSSGAGLSQTAPFSLTWGGSNHEPLTGDFNGDGLTDIAIADKTTGNVDVRFSTSSGWTASAALLTGFGVGKTHTSADFDGDGRSDLAYYNNPTGQVVYALSRGSSFTVAASPLPVTFAQTSPSDELQVGDFNGDGIADPGVFNRTSGQSQLAFSQGSLPDVLVTVTNGVGGTTTIIYQLSSTLTNTKLPFVTPVVQKVTASDGLGNSYTTTYSYDGGLYDAPTKEFRGFATAKVVDAESNMALTQFHQDEHKKGRAFHSELKDASGNLWTKTDQTWSCVDPYPGVHVTKLDQTDSYTYDGDATFKQMRSRFTYDAFGNITRTDEDGDVTVTGDERATVTTYVLNEAAWILNNPSLVQTFNASGTVVAQRRFYYDGATQTTTPPTAGLLTKEEEWRNLPTEQWLATSLTYDAYGNVASVTDALGRTTANAYDANTKTYLIQITNALSHTRQLAYDARLGAVTSSTDQNNVTTTTEYDTLGRVTKVIGPNDTAALPTISYAYDLSANPAKTTVSTRIQSGAAAVLTVYTFTDGLGRTIQTRPPAEDSTKQVVTGTVEFNARGLAIKQWVPYLSTASTTYVPRSSEPGAGSLAFVSYTYDPIGRLLTTTDPDGSVSSTSYSDWVITATDAKGNQTRRTQDASGRLIRVEELNGTQTHTTTYVYDTLNNLTKVTDAAGNVTTITYDSLGRKLSMTDPDMGRWTYAYDAVDNLTSQTDARGVVTTFQYDVLNRVIQKSYTLPPGSEIINPGTVTYAYDNPAQQFSKGKLTSVTDATGSAAFAYDNLGRVTQETKTVGGTPRTSSRTYDLLGRVLTLTYPNGAVATHTYNTQGGIETMTLQSQGQPVKSIVSNMDYNAAGQITKLVYGNGVVSDNTFNPQTLRLNTLKTTGPSGTLQDFSYSFDPVGNVTAITDRIHTATQSFQYDALNRLTQASGSYGTSSYAYDPIGNMTSKEGVTMTYGLPNGSKPHAVTSTSDGWTMAYDANGNILQKTPTSSSMVAQRLRYDTENRLTEVKTAQEATVTLQFKPGYNFFSLPVIPENASIAAVFPSFAQDLEWIGHFNADYNDPTVGDFKFYVNHPKFNDFTTLEYGKGYQAYCKNPNGLTVQITGKLPTTPYSLNLLPEWHLVPAIAVDGPQPVSWLLSGVNYDQIKRWNPTTQQLETPTQILPGESYFVHVVSAGLFNPPSPRDQTTTFVYDGDGGKVKQVTAAGTTTYLGDQVEIAPDGMSTNYVFAGSLRVAAMDSTGALRFYHQDHLGSSNVVTDGSGVLVELNEHTPYGSVSRHEGTTDVRHKFTGQEQDAGTGLVLFPARAYDPKLGRFLQPDSFVQDPSDPQALNRYSYVRNNPLNLVDPSGYGWFRKLVAAVVAVFVAVAVTILAPECFGCGVVAGLATYAAISGTGTSRGPSPSSGGVPQHVSVPDWNAGTFASAGSGQPPLREASDTLSARGPPPESSQDRKLEAAKTLVQNLGVSNQAAEVVARQLASPKTGDAAQSIGFGFTVGGSFAPFVLPSVFASGSVGAGVTTSGQPFVQMQGSVLGGIGIFGGFGPQLGLSYVPHRLPPGVSMSKSLQVQMNIGAGPAIGGSVDLGPQGVSITGGFGRRGLGLGVMYGIGGSATVTVAAPPVSEWFRRK